MNTSRAQSVWVCVFTQVARVVVEENSHHLRGTLAHFDTGPDLQEQVDAHQEFVSNVEQAFNQIGQSSRFNLTGRRMKLTTNSRIPVSTIMLFLFLMWKTLFFCMLQSVFAQK